MWTKFLCIGAVTLFPTGTFPTDIFSAQADIVSQIKGARRWVEKKSPNIVVKLVKGLKTETYFFMLRVTLQDLWVILTMATRQVIASLVPG